MNIVATIQRYVKSMVESVQGMKVILLDEETMNIVSLVYARTEIMSKEVYLFELLGNQARERMAHLNAIVFVRPTDRNIRALCDEMNAPRYGEYHLFFSNIVKNSQLEEVANSDAHEVVRAVHEYFADARALSPPLATLGVPHVLYSARQSGWLAYAKRAEEGCVALLLALRKRPAVRYVLDSDQCKALAHDVAKRVQQESECFDFRQGKPAPLLLLLDRKDDPVTPLLSQWTYQAMIHELIGLNNNRVDLTGCPGIRKDMQQAVLSAEQDAFYRKNMYCNFGDLGMAIKELVDSYQAQTKTNERMESIADIKRFIDAFPDFKKLAGNVSKHVALMGELSRRVDQRSLLQVSELEQELANKHDHGTAKTNVLEFLKRDDITKADKLRLVILYALRYEETSSNAIGKCIEELAYAGLEPSEIRSVANMTEYAGAARRHGDLFQNRNVLSIMRGHVKRGLKGAQNVYTEHTPLLSSILEQWAKGRLRESEYGTVGGMSGETQSEAERARELIVFMVGGVTYEEALAVHEFNESNAELSVLLAGTDVHSSASFLDAVNKCRQH